MTRAKLRAAPMAVPEVVVVVADAALGLYGAIARRCKLQILLLMCTCFLSAPLLALVIPEDRADALYHAYDGGGVTVNGPSILVRKGYKEKVSGYANYYQDMVTSASIDVLTSGSRYTEKRTEYSLGMEYLANRALVSVGYTNSSESDYDANTLNFGISQDFFGDMTTLAMGYSRGDDEVRRNNKDAPPTIMGDAQKQRYSLGLSQILTKSWIIAFSVETVVDDGFLRNPYRQYNYLGEDDAGNPVRLGGEEIYPETRNSDAFALRTIYYLPYRASVRIEGRTFSDSWGIKAQNYEIRYTHTLRTRLLLELKARTYSQDQADFYYDLFPEQVVTEGVFVARDKELSTYSTNSIGMGVTYEFAYKLPFAKKHSASLYWDFIQFDYDNFNNALLSREQDGQPPEYAVGEEPAYSFEANVIRLFYTVNY
jgi:hypothetical protein